MRISDELGNSLRTSINAQLTQGMILMQFKMCAGSKLHKILQEISLLCANCKIQFASKQKYRRHIFGHAQNAVGYGNVSVSFKVVFALQIRKV